MWAPQHRIWSEQAWRSVVFSDEAAIEIGAIRSQYIRYGRGASILCSYTQSRRHFTINFMFWGCITANGPVPLIPVQGRMTAGSYTEILKDHVIELKNRFDNSVQWVYQQDNAPCHKSWLATRFLADNNIRTLK